MLHCWLRNASVARVTEAHTEGMLTLMGAEIALTLKVHLHSLRRPQDVVHCVSHTILLDPVRVCVQQFLSLAVRGGQLLVRLGC